MARPALSQRVETSAAHGLRDILGHLLCILVEERIVLYDQQAVAALFKNGHELEDAEGSADLQGSEPAV